MDLIANLSNEWHVISGAPVSFLSACFLVGSVIFGVTKWILSGVINTKQARIELLQARLDAIPTGENVRVRSNTDHAALKIIFGDSPPFDVLTTDQNGTKQRAISIGIRNGGDGLLTNCAVYIRSNWPTWHGVNGGTILMERGFDLHADKTRYILIAGYVEFFPATKAPGNTITVCIPLAPVYNPHLFLPVDHNPQKNVKQLITIVAKSADAYDSEAQCYLWVDHQSHGVRLRLERA
jgi:hypothetical protein